MTQNKTDTFKELVIESLGDDLKFLIHYGSSVVKDFQNDIDFIVIIESEREFTGKQIGKLDLGIIGMEQFDDFSKFLDPIAVTKPILTGKLLFGDESQYQNIKNDVMS